MHYAISANRVKAMPLTRMQIFKAIRYKWNCKRHSAPATIQECSVRCISSLWFSYKIWNSVIYCTTYTNQRCFKKIKCSQSECQLFVRRSFIVMVTRTRMTISNVHVVIFFLLSHWVFEWIKYSFAANRGNDSEVIENLVK